MNVTNWLEEARQKALNPVRGVCRDCGIKLEKAPGVGRWPLTCEPCKIKARARPDSRPEVTFSCLYCGKEVRRRVRSNTPTKFCSLKCNQYYRSGRPKQPMCQHCGKALDPAKHLRKFCSMRCKKRRKSALVEVEEQKCPECRRRFIPKQLGQLFCCVAHQKRNRSRPRCSERRALLRNGSIASERVDKVAVFERDGWRCQLCGRKTPRRLMGAYDDRAPELDHIIPVKPDDEPPGPHLYTNVQCACRECNGRKGNRPLGQLRLFG